MVNDKKRIEKSDKNLNFMMSPTVTSGMWWSEKMLWLGGESERAFRDSHQHHKMGNVQVS